MSFLPLFFQRRFSGFGTPPKVRDKMSHTLYYGGASPVGISHSDGHVIFKLQISVDRYIVAKKHASSRISKRMEKRCKRRIFPRLWTNCVILNMQTGINKRKGDMEMNTALTIQEKLKDLRVA